MGKKFNCTSCGACCRFVGLRIKQGISKDKFPYGTKADGMTCEKLADDGVTCTIYDHRPTFCSVEKQWSKKFKKDDRFKIKKQYYKWQMMFCKKLQDKVGVLEELLVNPEQYN